MVFDVKLIYIRAPTSIHNLLWILALGVGIVFHGLHYLDRLPRLEALLALSVALTVWLVTIVCMITVSLVVTRAMAHGTTLSEARKQINPDIILHTFGHLTFARYITRLWTLHTELPIRYIQIAYQNVHNVVFHVADKEVYSKLSYWSYISNANIKQSPSLAGLKAFAVVLTLVTVIYYALTETTPGWAIIYGLATWIVMWSIIHAKQVYYNLLWATLLVMSFAPMLKGKVQADQLRMYKGLFVTETLKLFDKDVKKVETIDELLQKEPEQTPHLVEKVDPRVKYVKDNLGKGYQEETIRHAFVEHGISEHEVDEIFRLAKN